MNRLLLLSLLLVPSLDAQDEAATNTPPEPAPLVVWNREIVVFRATTATVTPTQRRDNTLNRLSAISDFLLYEPVVSRRGQFGNVHGVSFMIGDHHLFSLVDDDVDPGAGEDLDSLAKSVLGRLEELREAKRSQRSLPMILRGVATALAATIAFAALIWMLRWLGRKLRRFVTQRTSRVKQLKVRGFDLRPLMLQTVRRIFGLLGWGIALAGAYGWLAAVFAQFPYTSPWGAALGKQVAELAGGMVASLVHALPRLAVVVVIFALTRWFTRLADLLFRQFESRKDEGGWLGSDTARATRRIIVVAVWILGVTLAYPYIPGSDSAAFKGISVLIGLMVSLGSTGLVNQVMSGFVVLYSGAVRTGEYARVGDVEGTIQEIGLLSTKVLTPRREYVTVPNAVLIARETLNYSRIKENERRTELSTTVTIGYDAPWRTVHELLLSAADRTPGIRDQPEPRVLQTALSDFYVEYELRFVPAEAAQKGKILSELHQRIQDAFHQAGLQIMSPHFESQPAEAVLPPKAGEP